ncbi:MAG: BrnT family toxin [Gemmatimonadaceae bacterium]
MGSRQERRESPPPRIRLRLAAQVFRGIYIEYPDERRDYGERRFIALGVAEGLPLSVVFTDRTRPTGSTVRRIISARVSNRKERTRYGKAIEVL